MRNTLIVCKLERCCINHINLPASIFRSLKYLYKYFSVFVAVQFAVTYTKKSESKEAGEICDRLISIEMEKKVYLRHLMGLPLHETRVDAKGYKNL